MDEMVKQRLAKLKTIQENIKMGRSNIISDLRNGNILESFQKRPLILCSQRSVNVEIIPNSSPSSMCSSSKPSPFITATVPDEMKKRFSMFVPILMMTSLGEYVSIFMEAIMAPRVALGRHLNT
ncbi:hypothetical protein NQ318_002218 [Aromia moschata]|uniref:Uncharacterized protein n=1 Tax=Aromia moschata TaxID=1265417 RepID=A0AAV8Z520_9CUCU|nr:hypothetical protein NQ318_002218 [Aromia moschata]